MPPLWRRLTYMTKEIENLSEAMAVDKGKRNPDGTTAAAAATHDPGVFNDGPASWKFGRRILIDAAVAHHFSWFAALWDDSQNCLVVEHSSEEEELEEEYLLFPGDAVRTLDMMVHGPHGSKRMAERVGRLLVGEGDQNDVDVFLQFACFGEEVYA